MLFVLTQSNSIRQKLVSQENRPEEMAFKSCFKFFGQIIQKISSILSKLRENAKKDMALATALNLCVL